MRSITLSATTVALALTLSLGLSNSADAGGRAGGKVTGKAVMNQTTNGNEISVNFLVHERNGYDAKGMVSIETTENGFNPGAYWEGDVDCAVVIDNRAEFIVTATDSGDGLGGDHPFVQPGAKIWYVVVDGGEPSVGVDEAYSAGAPSNGCETIIAGDSLGTPRAGWESLGNGNLQVHSK